MRGKSVGGEYKVDLARKLVWTSRIKVRGKQRPSNKRALNNLPEEKKKPQPDFREPPEPEVYTT